MSVKTGILGYGADGLVAGFYCYLIVCPHGDDETYVKVGVSKSPLERLQAIRQNIPFQPDRLCSVRLSNVGKARELERSILEKFKDHAARGEWLRIPREAMLPFRQGVAELTAKYHTQSVRARWVTVDAKAYAVQQRSAAHASRRAAMKMLQSQSYRDFRRHSLQ